MRRKMDSGDDSWNCSVGGRGVAAQPAAGPAAPVPAGPRQRPAAPLPNADETLVNVFVQAGFERDQVDSALQRAKNCPRRAASILVSGDKTAF